jgi:hypothetical protein
MESVVRRGYSDDKQAILRRELGRVNN